MSMKKVAFLGAINERTGYGIHASRFVEQLSKLTEVKVNDVGTPGAVSTVSISLLDSVSIQNISERLPYPSILYNVWESTEQPSWFMERLKFFDQLWVPSEWQRAASIAQGVPEEFVKVVPEGVDPGTYKPWKPNPLYSKGDTFNFLHVGQWQPRKSTLEIVQSFLRSFPNKEHSNVRLYLSADTLFPSDNFKSTEERLAHHGLNDPRIIPIHYEERDQYIRRLQAAHCFVSCSRSEGWGLPIIEAMACGIPTIVADWSGSTEYAGNAILVPIRKLIKPFGIYGNWDVPGQWCEPDFDYLANRMKAVHESYSRYKEHALKESENIRTKFSWAAAAKKAMDIIEAIPEPNKLDLSTVSPIPESARTAEQEIQAFARSKGYEIKTLERRSAIFVVDCWPSSPAKMLTLQETIKQIHGFGYPVLVSSHFPLPEDVIKQADYYLYERQDIMSGDDKPMYWRTRLDGTVEQKPCTKEYQGVAAINNFRNSIDFCRGRFDWVYQMSADMEVDLAQWLALVHSADKPMVCIPYEGKKDGIGGGLWAGRTEILDQVIPRLASWKQYADLYPDVRFVAERWIYNYVSSKCDIDNMVSWIAIETQNRFDNVDRSLFDDEFQCHFVEGPYLNILGQSGREYDVEWSNPIDGKSYVLKQKAGVWSRPTKKYFTDWTVTVSLDGVEKFRHTLTLKGTNVIISLGSKALGDTLAWVPYAEEFRKKHQCTVYLSTWWNNILDYPEIRKIKPGDVVENVYASYDVGCFDGQLDRNKTDWRTSNLQKVAADILGVDYVPLRAKLKYEPAIRKGNGHPPKPYICFSEFSTMRNKLWNRDGAWQRVIDYLIAKGYDCVSISTEQSHLTGIIDHCGQSIEQTLTDISGAAFYIGLNAGPTWLAYSLDIPHIMITGVSEPWNDPPNPYRVSIDVCRPGCFNDPSIPIDRGWEWCPRKKDYACTREITEEMVFEAIESILQKEETHAVKKRKVSSNRIREHKGNDELGASAGPGGGGSDA